MNKTNRVIYPFKIKKGNLNYSTLVKEFPDDKRFENFIDIPDTDYQVSLAYQGETDEFYFFSLIRCDKNNITVSNFKDKKDKEHYLKEFESVKQHSLFAIAKKEDILLVLYNYEGFRMATSTLKQYIKNKLEVDVEFDIQTRDLTDKEVLNYLQNVKHIIIKKAKKDYKQFEQSEKGSSKKKIKKYTQSSEEIIKFQRMGGSPLEELKSLINRFKERKYDKIIIDAYNMGEVDILEPVYISFHCKVKTEDKLAKINDFKEEIKRVRKENEKFFSDYTSS